MFYSLYISANDSSDDDVSIILIPNLRGLGDDIIFCHCASRGTRTRLCINNFIYEYVVHNIILLQYYNNELRAFSRDEEVKERNK